MICPKHLSGLLIIVLLSRAFTFCSADQLSLAATPQIASPQQLYHSMLSFSHLQSISRAHLDNPFGVIDKTIPSPGTFINNVIIANKTSVA